MYIVSKNTPERVLEDMTQVCDLTIYRVVYSSLDSLWCTCVAIPVVPAVTCTWTPHNLQGDTREVFASQKLMLLTVV